MAVKDTPTVASLNSEDFVSSIFEWLCVNTIILFAERLFNIENFLISKKDLAMCVILESSEQLFDSITSYFFKFFGQ